MSDEVRAANYGCCDRVGGIGGDNDWLQWIVIIFIVWWLFGGDFFNRGCCR